MRALLEVTFADLRGVTIIILVATAILAVAAFLVGRTGEVADTVSGAAEPENRTRLMGIGLVVIGVVVLWIAVGPEVALLALALLVGWWFVVGPVIRRAGLTDTMGPDMPRLGRRPRARSMTPRPTIANRRERRGTARVIWAEERVEVIAAILLALATVLSAWGAYQATRWSGEQANNYAESAALRAASGRHGTVASRQIQIDVQTFIAWVDAKAQSNDRLADFYVERFREEFLPAVHGLAAGRRPRLRGPPGGHPIRPARIRRSPQQVLADDLFAQADAALAEAQWNNQISDNFVLTAVLFASVLLFAGIAPRFRPQWIRWTMLTVAGVVFCIGLVVEFRAPQNVGLSSRLSVATDRSRPRKHPEQDDEADDQGDREGDHRQVGDALELGQRGLQQDGHDDRRPDELPDDDHADGRLAPDVVDRPRWTSRGPWCPPRPRSCPC